MNTLYMIGNTHFDPVWLWTWDEAMASIRSTFRSALERMKEYPDFIYSFCTPAVFEWIEEVDPDMFAEIKQRVAEGRWDVGAEGWWLQPDCNIPSGESLVRQGLYAQRYLQTHFGMKANTVFNLDSFGHNAMMPQFLTKCDLKWYVFSRPSKWEMTLPDELFDWKAPDGSVITAYRSGSTGNAGSSPQNLTENIEMWRKVLPDRKHDMLQVYGVTNHGGAPTKKAIADISVEMEKNDTIAVKFGSTNDFFSAQVDKPKPMLTGELPTRNYGPFINRTDVKRNNRRSEYALNHAEHASLLAEMLTGRIYPKEKLTRGWKDLMFNQFHDIIGGCCIPDSYDDARNMHGRVLQNANETKHFALQSICRRMKTLGDNKESVWNVVLFNLNGTDYHGVVEAEVQWAWEFPWYSGGIELIDDQGIAHPAQIITEKSAIPGFRSRFAFNADIPAMGWRMYAVRKTNTNVERCWDETPVESPFLLRVYEDAGDTWCFNTVKGYGALCEEPVLVERRVVDNGPVMTTVKQEWSFRRSIIEEYITVYADTNRVDYRYSVNWNEKFAILKLIPKDMNVNELTAAIPGGSLVRPCDGREYPVGEWMRWQQGDHSVTLLLDGQYSYDTQNGAARLSLVRSPLYGDLRIGDLNPNEVRQFMEQGKHEGRVALLRDVPTLGEAAALAAHHNGQPVVIEEANHEGDLPASMGFLAIESDHVALSAFKKAEDGSDYVLRLVEMDNKADTIAVKLGKNALNLAFTPCEIKTIRVSEDGRFVETNMLEEA